MLNFRGVVPETLPSKPFCFHISKAVFAPCEYFFVTGRQEINKMMVKSTKKSVLLSQRTMTTKNKFWKDLCCYYWVIPQKVVFQALAFFSHANA